MIELDFAFSESKARDIYSATLEKGYIKPEQVNKFRDMIKSKEFRAICLLLVTMSDRKGRNDNRMEDAYASFPKDIELFFDKLYTNLTKTK